MKRKIYKKSELDGVLARNKDGSVTYHGKKYKGYCYMFADSNKGMFDKLCSLSLVMYERYRDKKGYLKKCVIIVSEGSGENGEHELIVLFDKSCKKKVRKYVVKAFDLLIEYFSIFHA